ncbi:MAG: acyl-CoA dehydrogenase [Magnetococcus sp. YQC-5]
MNISLMIVLGIVTAMALLLLPGPIRRRVVTTPILAAFRRALPPLSSTEREALEAGTVWWDRELFSGQPDWRRLLSLPAPRLTTEEIAFLDGPVTELCQRLDDWQISHEHQDLPPEIWRFLKQHRFFGLIIPKAWGGWGFSAMAHSEVVSRIASRSVTAAVTVMVPNSLGPAELLLHYGTEAQKHRYLPGLARGDEIPCFALTSPEAGSDAGSMPDTGVVEVGTFQGRFGVVGVRLNWNKRYITLGPVATVLGLAFKLSDPHNLLGKGVHPGITLALIPTNLPGIAIGSRHDPMSIPFQNGPTTGTNVFIPVEWLIGGPERAGQGWRMLMERLAEGRSISLPALSVGADKLAVRAAGAYAAVRKQFNLSIGSFEGVAEVLGRMAGETYRADAARSMTAVAVDQGERPAVISALVKYQLTEGMRRVVNDAMDIFGGAAICKGPRNIMASVYQSIPIGITVEGANILTRTLIVFGQGAMRSHPYLLRELEAAGKSDHATAVLEFDRAFFGHLAFSLRNGLRTFLLGVTLGWPVCSPVDGGRSCHFRRLSRMSAAFALTADLSLAVLQGGLKRKESLSGRMADVLSHLYLASAVLKRFHDDGQPSEDQPLVDWSIEESLWQIQKGLTEVLDNFPVRPVAWLLRGLVFPMGLPFKKPSDRLVHQLARIAMTPSATRDRLTHGIFLPDAAGEPLADLEDALVKIMAATPLEAKIRRAGHAGDLNAALAAGVVTELEASRVRAAARARSGCIQVDDFPSTVLFKEKAA